MVAWIRLKRSCRSSSLPSLFRMASILRLSCSICSEMVLNSSSFSSISAPLSTLSLTIFSIRLFRASIRRSSRSISSEPPLAPIASPIVAFIRVRYVEVSSSLNLFKALTIASVVQTVDTAPHDPLLTEARPGHALIPASAFCADQNVCQRVLGILAGGGNRRLL